MLSNDLKAKLKEVYSANSDFIDVLMLSGICADEFEFGAVVEDMTPEERLENGFLPTSDDLVTTELFGVTATTIYEERKYILDKIKRWYDADVLDRLPHLFELNPFYKLANVGLAEIIAERPVSDHPDDSHLSIVLAYLPEKTCEKYVTWLCNTTSGQPQFNWGHYFEDKSKAYQDFEERG